MGKKRIFEIAKELGVKTTEITELLAKHNITKSNFSGVDDADMAIISGAFKKSGAKPALKPAARSKTATATVKAKAEPVQEKAKPAAVKPKAEPTEKKKRRSLIVKPVIMTVETKDGKTMIRRPVAAENLVKTPPAPPQKTQALPHGIFLTIAIVMRI